MDDNIFPFSYKAVQYGEAAEIIKTAILLSQYEAAKGVNRVQLALYFGVGKFLSAKTRHGAWGTGAIQDISDRLHRELPGLRGFSANSLKNMRKFYENWNLLDSSAHANETTTKKASNSSADNSTIAIVELQDIDNKENIIRSISVDDIQGFPIEDFFRVPFTHHLRIIEGTDNLDARYYYIHKTAEENLSVDRLTKLIKAGDFENAAEIPNNFSTAISNPVNARKAVMMFKDEYLLDFINVEEIGERDPEDIDERVVEQQIVQNIKKFIMTFGRDFAFIGNQYHLEVYGVEHFPDLLFFNRELNAMVCVELNTGAFKPGDSDARNNTLLRLGVYVQ